MHIMEKRHHIILFLLLIVTTLQAEISISIDPKKAVYDLTASSLLCTDELGEMKAEMLFQDNSPPNCHTVSADHLPYGYTDATLWLRVSLRNPGRFDLDRIAEMGNPLLDFIDLYVVREGKIVEHFSSGDRRAFKTRPLANRQFRFPVTLAAGATTQLIWKIRSETAIDLPMTLYTPETLQTQELHSFLFFGLFYGILIILALYNFVFFLIFRKTIYLYYVGFILFYALMQLSFDGLTPLFVPPGWYWIYNDGVPFFVNLTILSAVLFGQRFLDTSLHAPKLNRLLNVILIVNMLPIILSLFSLYPIAVKLTTFLAAVTPPILLLAGIVVLKANPRPARFYLLAWSLFFVGSVLLALHKFGMVPSWWFVLHAQQFGVLFKVIVLSYALGDQLQSLLYVDQLTGVGNRRSLERLIDSAMRYAQKKHLPFAIAIIDIDDFNTINDSLTHKTGDELLKLLTARLKSHIRRNDTLVRLGQDEFLILIERVQNSAELSLIVEEILAEVRRPFRLERRDIHITASMGIALYPNDGGDYDTLIGNSDAALHKAKELGKNRFHFFNRTIDSTATKQLRLYNDLFGALEKQELFLLYQPKVNARDNTLAGVEALLRWKHPELGVIYPDEFIGIAEKRDLIIPITRWILEASCKAVHQWRSAGFDVGHVAVNITAKDIGSKHFITELLNLLKRFDLSADIFELELTERIIVEEGSMAAEEIKSLHDAGLKIAIDDFGTGYSSFSYLKSFQVDTIKIDKSFIDQIETDPKAATIVKAMASLGHALGMQVVIEGVENEGQFHLLTKMPCDLFQGYYFDRPLSTTALQTKYHRS